jgi:hypothetical protein
LLLLSRLNTAPPRPADFLKPKGPDLSRLTAHYEAVAHEFQQKPEAHTITLVEGSIVVDGRHVQNPRFQYDTVSWSEKTSAFASSGCLHAVAGGTQLAGVITYGKDEHSAVPAFVTLALADLVFQTQVCPIAEASKPAVWADGPPLRLGTAFVRGRLSPTAKLNGVSVNVAALRPAPNTSNAVVDVAIKPNQDGPGQPFENPPWPVPYKSKIVLGLDGRSFDGTMVEFEHGPSILWRGAAPEAPPALHAKATRSPETAVALDLSLTDLVSVSTTAGPEIARTLFDDFTKYGMADEWREQLFGFAKPALDGETSALYNRYPQLFTDHVSDAAILRQLATMDSNHGGPSTPISAAEQRKLDYFFDDCIMNVPGYYEVSDHITQIAWVRASPHQRLRDYTSSPVTPSWGQQLYDSLTSNDALTAAAFTYIGSDYDLTPINRNTDLLLALSPDRDHSLPTKDGDDKGAPCTLASLYHLKVLAAIGPQASPLVQMQNDTAAVQDYADWIASWFQKMLTDLANRVEDPNNPDIPPATQAAMRQALNELQELARTPDGMRSLALEIASSVQQARGTRSNPGGFLGRAQNALANSKIAQGLKKLVLTASVGYSMQQVIVAFNNWSSLSDKQKAQTIIMTSELPFDMLGVAADLELPEAFSKLMSWLGRSGARVAVERSLVLDVEAEQNVFSRLVGWLGDALGTEGSEGASFIARFFGKDSGLMKGFGVLAAAAACGFAAYQIYEDKDGSDTTKALDALQLVANATMLAGAIVTMVAAESAWAVLGPVGAVVGVVLMIVAILLPQPKPESPADKYMDDRGRNYLNGLDTPPADWNAPTLPPTGQPS